MNREQIDEKYKWGINNIYSDNETIKKDIDLVLSKINDLVKYKDIELDSKSLYEMLDLEMSINRTIEKLEVYASLLCDEDTSNNKNQELKEKISNLISKFISQAYFTDINILKLDFDTITEFISSNSNLEEYRIYLTNLFRYKKYTLSDKEEKLLSNLSKMFGNNYETYELLKDSDMCFPSFKVNDNEYKLDNNLYSLYIENEDREIRKKAFYTLYETYKNFKNVYANLIVSNIKEETSLSKIKGYTSSLEKSMYKDEVNVSVYNNLVTTVNNNLDVIHKYYDLKKKVLNLDELHLYDVYVDMVSSNSSKYEFENAKEIVISALSVLGEDYINTLKKGISDKWIDVYPSRGKRTGGYSSGSYDTDPYILLNYQDKYDDMSTLAHELGHSMHSYYTRQNNPYQYGHYSILVAEVASTVNELLLAKYVIRNSDDKNLKLFILNRILELFRATVYRQTMFSTFEKTIYEYVENDKPLTADIMCDIYYDLNKKYFGDNVILDDEIKYEWERIPHFYYNFYVYKYATGLSCACYIVNGLLDGTINVGDYLSFLKCGTSKSPLDSLKVTGVDLTDKKVIEEGIKMFDSTIKEFEELYFN